MRIGIRHSVPLPGPFYVSTSRRRNRKGTHSGMLLLLVAWLPAILMGWESLAVYIPVAVVALLVVLGSSKPRRSVRVKTDAAVKDEIKRGAARAAASRKDS